MSDNMKAAAIIAAGLVVHGWLTGHRISPEGYGLLVNPLGIVSVCTSSGCR